MRYLIILGVLLTIAAFGIYGFGTNLPADHSVSKTAIYHQPIDKVWEMVVSYDKAPEWSSTTKKVDRLENLDGLPVWRFYDTQGHFMDVQVITSEPPHKHKSQIIDTDLPFGGIWIITLESSEDGTKTKLTLTEEGFITSPLWRFFAHFLMGRDVMVKQYLMELGQYFGETPTVE